MSVTVRASPPEHYGWIAERSGYEPWKDFRAIEAVTETGRILAMVGYDHFYWNSVEMHIAVEVPTRAILRPAFAFPFLQLGMGLVTGRIPSDNAKALGLSERLGFRETHRVGDAIRVGVDEVLLEMRREECRWLQNSNRKAA